MKDHTTQSVEDFLNALARRSPTPGGGGATGLVGALGCALAQMVAAYSISSKTEPAAREKIESVLVRLNRSDQLLRSLISQDASAYETMAKAGREAKADPGKRESYQLAVLSALAVPMEMAALVADNLMTLDQYKPLSNRYLHSDLGIVAVLCLATVRSARYTIQVNLKELDDAEKRTQIEQEIDQTVAKCESLAASLGKFVHSAS